MTVNIMQGLPNFQEKKMTEQNIVLSIIQCVTDGLEGNRESGLMLFSIINISQMNKGSVQKKTG